jgi:hypothetical protein
VAGIYAKKVNVRVRGAAYANLVSLPLVWFLLPFLHLNFGALFLVGETSAIAFESGFLHLANRRHACHSNSQPWPVC